MADAETGAADGLTVAEFRLQLTRTLADAGIASAALDARLLLGHALGLDHAGLIAAADRPVGAAEHAAAADLLRRRATGEPVARILGAKEFWGLELRLSAETLVPRPDTETVVEAALAALPDRNAPLRIADLGTGTGALLLALLSERPRATGIGIDISADALRTAAENAQALGLADRARFVACDFATALRAPLDLVVSNPPYIPRADILALDRDVRLHDPHRALDGGTDGLDAYRAILADAPRLLGERGVLVLEIGIGQADAVTAIATARGLAVEPPRHDVAGIPRALTIRPAGDADKKPLGKSA